VVGVSQRHLVRLRECEPVPSTGADGEAQRSRSDLLEIVTQVAAGLIGVTALALGVLAVFASDNGAGTSALLAVGLVLLLVAAFGNQIARISGGGVSVELRERAVRSAAHLQRAANELLAHGDTEAAASLTAEADALLDLAEAVRPQAEAYEQVRATTAAGPARTRRMEEMIESARSEPADPEETAVDLRELFYQGGEGARIYSLGRMQANPEVRDFEVALDGIRRSRSAFEQYHALMLAEEMLPELEVREKNELAATLELERSRFLTPGTSRWSVAQRLLRKLRNESP
jgi:hypothetical protein